MSRSTIPRHIRAAQRAADIAKIENIISSTGDREPTQKRQAKQTGYRSGEGDRQRLRAIPVITEAIGGTIPGTDPLQHVIDEEERLERQGTIAA